MSAARPHSCILDASALLHEEPGAGIVEPLLEEAVIPNPGERFDTFVVRE